MKQKKYVHIKEYQLTKLLLDYLELDTDDDGRLYGESPLKYRSKFFTLVPYKDMKDFQSDELIPIRPFTNINHANYLIDLFSSMNNCETLFEYKDMEKDDTVLEGVMKLVYNKDTKKIKIFGFKNLSVLYGGILAKMVLSSDKFKENIGSIIKLDKKITDSKKSRK